MTHNELVIVVAATFMVDHNTKKPNLDPEVLMDRALRAAHTFVTYCELKLNK